MRLKLNEFRHTVLRASLITLLMAFLVKMIPASFSPPVAVNSNASIDTTSENLPAIAAGSNGTMVAVWVGPSSNSLDPRGNDEATGDSINQDLYYARSTDHGQIWSKLAPLKTNFATDYSDDIEPHVTTDGKGHWMVVWRSVDPLDGTIGFDADILMTYSSDDGITWSAPAPVNNDASTDPGGLGLTRPYSAYDYSPAISVDQQGHWMVIWVRSDNRSGSWLDSIMVATSSDAGAHWSNPYAFQTRTESGMFGVAEPTLATNSQGRWIAGWSSRNTSSSDYDLYFAYSDNNGTNWSAPALLNTNGASDTGGDGGTSFACDGQGHWLAVWNSYDTMGGTLPATIKILYTASNNNGQTWSAPAPIKTDAATDTSVNSYPHVVYDGIGNWVVGWTTNKLGGDSDFVYSMSTVGTPLAWSAPLPINPWAQTDTGATSDNGLQMASDGKGSWMSIFSSASDLGGTNLNHDLDIIAIFNAYQPPPSVTQPVAVNSNATTDTLADNLPTIASGKNGTMVAVWVAPSANTLDARGSDDATGDGINQDLYFARSTDLGQTWSKLAPLKTNFASDYYDDIEPAITTDGQGKWMVVWRSMDPLGGTIGFDRDILMTYSSDDGRTWSAPAPVNNDAASDPGGLTSSSYTAYDFHPVICCNGQGQWMVTWVRCDNRSGSWVNSIMVATSSDAGAHWSNPYAFQTRTESGMAGVAEPTLATNSQGRWIAGWSSRNASSSDYDLYFAYSDNNGSSWSTPALLNTNGSSDAGGDGGTSLASDGQGHWLAVWNSLDTLGGTLPATIKILYTASNNNGLTWSAPAAIQADAATDTSSNTYPHVVYDGLGHWVVGWTTNKLGGDSDFVYSMSAVGPSLAWSAPLPINPWAQTDTGATSDNGLQMASDGLGRWIAIFSSAYDMGGTNLNHDLDILAILFNNASGTPPSVVLQPKPLTLDPGSLATFDIQATGTQPLRYQWRRDQSNLADDGRILGTGGATLTIFDARLGDAGFYDCVVTNNAGTTTSQMARLMINPSLAVVSDHNIPCAAVGVHAYTSGTLVNVPVPTIVTSPDGLTRWLNSSWTTQGAQGFNIPGSTDIMLVLDRPTTLTLYWDTQYKLTTTANPVAGGMITLADGSTLADGWYNANTTVTLKAIAQPGYWFSTWSGGYGGFGTPIDIPLNGPVTVSAQFSPYKNGVKDWARYDR